jgi:hypothetical protein
MLPSGWLAITRPGFCHELACPSTQCRESLQQAVRGETHLTAAGAAGPLGRLPRQVLQLLAEADGPLAGALLVAPLPGRLALQHTADASQPRVAWPTKL